MRKKILVKGPVLTQSGYGEQARFALRSLRAREDIFDIFIIPTAWGQTGWVSVPCEEREWIDAAIAKTHVYTQQGGSFDLSLQITIPNEWENLALVNVGYTAGIETTRVAPIWLQKANEMDKIIVVSNHAKEGFENTIYQGQDTQTGQHISLACNTPIEVVNYPVRKFKKINLKLNLEYDFNYLAISQWGPRKNFDNLINWFVEENFDQEVGLVLKTSIKNNSIIDREYTEARLKAILAKHGDVKCKVYLLHGDLQEGEMTGLYCHPKIKCLISTTHGEGFGLPLFEASYNGLPVIAPAWSGQKDFLYIPDKRSRTKKMRPMFATVEYDLKNVQPEAVWDGVIQADSQWAFPRESSFKRRLRETRTEYSRFKKNATKLKKYLLENFTEENMYEDFVKATIGHDLSSIDKVDPSHICATAKNIENVKERATFLKEQVSNSSSQSDKIDILKNSFEGEKCYIISCGPTLTDHDEDKVRHLLKDNLVIAVKQSYDLYSDLVDFHVYNCANFKKYEYSQRAPIIVEASTSPYKLGPCDIKFFIKERGFDNSVAIKHNFSDWTYENQKFLRPYGPGIMYEAVLYLAEHLGVSEVITIGWDNKLLPSTADKQHFYDKENSGLNKEDFIHSNEVAKNPAAASTLQHEASITTLAMGNWADWLNSRGTVLKIVSSISDAPKSIERVEVE